MYIKQKKLDFSQYKVLVDAINDVVFQTDCEGNWIFLNDSWPRLMGYSIKESLFKPFFSFLHPEDVEKDERLFKPMMLGQKDFCSHEIRYMTKMGKISWMKVFSILIKDHSGNILGVQGTLQDINIDMQNRLIRTRAEMRIMQTLEKERELNVLKSSFVSLASHEFRTPLAVMRTSVELSEIYIEKNELELSYLNKHIKNINVEIDRLGDLIEKVLTVGKMESNAFSCELEDTDLVLLLKGSIQALETIQKDERTVHLQIEGIPRNVSVDPLLLVHAITNLISNAFKYSFGRPAPKVKLVFLERSYTIEITDYGIGIPPHAQGKISQAFYRADNVIAIPGSGLGVFIAKKFILLHNGSLDFESIPAQGTVFKIIMN